MKDKDEYFSKAINSLIENRNYINKTIIVINGYISEIKRKKINESIDLLRILKIELPINIGLSRALNIGLNKVETDWIARFDSDDICLSDRFKKMSQFIMKYGDQYDVIGTYIEEFNNKNKRRMVRRVPLNNKKIKKNLIF